MSLTATTLPYQRETWSTTMLGRPPSVAGRAGGAPHLASAGHVDRAVAHTAMRR